MRSLHSTVSDGCTAVLCGSRERRTLNRRQQQQQPASQPPAERRCGQKKKTIVARIDRIPKSSLPFEKGVVLVYSMIYSRVLYRPKWYLRTIRLGNDTNAKGSRRCWRVALFSWLLLLHSNNNGRLPGRPVLLRWLLLLCGCWSFSSSSSFFPTARRRSLAAALPAYSSTVAKSCYNDEKPTVLYALYVHCN